MKDQATILIIDLECTCNDDPPLARDEMEIIEIGAVIGKLTTQAFEVLDAVQLYVRPVIHPELTQFCTELTGIEQNQVAGTPTLDSACDTFLEWLSKYAPDAWGSWGKFDATQFGMETGLKQLQNPLAQLSHLNIKQLFARKRGHRVGLGRAIELSGMSFQGRPHSGLDDAKNIAHLVNHDSLIREAILARVES